MESIVISVIDIDTEAINGASRKSRSIGGLFSPST